MVSLHRSCWILIPSNRWRDPKSIILKFSKIPTVLLSLPIFPANAYWQRICIISSEMWRKWLWITGSILRIFNPSLMYLVNIFHKGFIIYSIFVCQNRVTNRLLWHNYHMFSSCNNVYFISYRPKQKAVLFFMRQIPRKKIRLQKTNFSSVWMTTNSTTLHLNLLFINWTMFIK
jgi:hypothetical protein